MLSLLWLLFVSVSLAATVPNDGTAHASCTNPEFAWSFNSLNQSACAVGEALGSACTDTKEFAIQAVPTGMQYSGLTKDGATPCACNRVYYNLLSACAVCQGASVLQWSEWHKNCSLTYDTYPNSIPAGTAISAWAYIPLKNDTWDQDTAAKDTGPDATPAPETTGKSPNGGMIAGIVVGGIAFVALVAFLIIFFTRRAVVSALDKSTRPVPEKRYSSNSESLYSVVPFTAGMRPMTPDSMYTTRPMTPETLCSTNYSSGSGSSDASHGTARPMSEKAKRMNPPGYTALPGRYDSPPPSVHRKHRTS